ncbi:TIR domain-containing protein [Geomonas oryzae]|uniref:TIR domain-containing protein n=1 Tax=Geomonas oryzae TaxID=2364273 RepID=UPI00100B829D|nr:nucleotide-binding protein [Geomonas oryzae]
MAKDLKSQACNTVQRQRDALLNIKDQLDARLPQWRDRTLRFLSDTIVDDELRILSSINSKTWEQEKQEYLVFLNDLEQGINDLPRQFLRIDPLPLNSKISNDSTSSENADKTNRVFVVHGHDSLAKTDVARTLEKVGLEAIILHEQPNEGKTIIEKFERDAKQVSFAVVLLTPDDIGYPINKPDVQKPRARQNVVLELGYFSGVLGRSNVCVLYKGEVEIPTDYLGVVYINMDEGGAWRFNLAKELRQAGLKADLNRLV